MSASDRVSPWLALAAAGRTQVAVMHVQRWDAERDGILTASRLRQRLEDQGLWVSERRYLPDDVRDEAPADHDTVEVVLIGLLKLSVGGETAILSAGDAAFVPRGAARSAEAVGPAPVISYAGAFLPNGPSPGRARRSFWR